METIPKITDFQIFLCLLKFKRSILAIPAEKTQFLAALSKDQISNIATNLIEDIIVNNLFGESVAEQQDDDCYEMVVYAKNLEGYACKYYTSPEQGIAGYAIIYSQ